MERWQAMAGFAPPGSGDPPIVVVTAFIIVYYTSNHFVFQDHGVRPFFNC